MADCLQGQDLLAFTHPSNSYARHCLIRLSCDKPRTCCNVPLATTVHSQYSTSLFSSFAAGQRTTTMFQVATD
ncbi:hypothetical protein J6590_012645 [Homalodisca vitripennis]|nr:hypothetical protein J6590_012645 [Homalodisca vitripennis]